MLNSVKYKLLDLIDSDYFWKKIECSSKKDFTHMCLACWAKIRTKLILRLKKKWLWVPYLIINLKMSRFAKEAGNCAGGQGRRIVSNLGGGDKSMGEGRKIPPDWNRVNLVGDPTPCPYTFCWSYLDLHCSQEWWSIWWKTFFACQCAHTRFCKVD